MGNKKGRQSKSSRKRSPGTEQRNREAALTYYHKTKEAEKQAEVGGSSQVEELHIEEGSELLPREAQTIDVGEGSTSRAPTGMDELLNLAQSVKKKISYRNLDHLLTMNVDTLRSLANAQQLSLAKKRSMKMIAREILGKFDNFETLEQAQLLSLILIDKKLEGALQLLGIDTSSKKRKFVDMQTDMIENLKKGLNQLGKRSRTIDKSITRKVMLTSIVGNNMRRKRNMSSVSSHIGFNRKTISRYVNKRIFLDDSTLEGNWAIMCRAPRSDRIDEEIKNLITSFWNDNTRPSSNTRDVIRHRISANQYEYHTKHWLDTTQHEMYVSFCSSNPNIKIGQTLFGRLKPYYIRTNKVFETCCCRYHIEFDLHYQVFRKFVEDTYGFEKAPPIRRSEFIASILCDKRDDVAGKINCIKGICQTCADLSLFPLKNEDIDVTKMVNCKSYKYVKNETKFGKESKRLEYVEEEINVRVFMENFKKLIQPYIHHAFFAKWQAQQFQTLRDNFPLGTIVSVVDFAENYSFVHQKAIQSEYYFSEQITIMVHVCYRHAQLDLDGIESTFEARVIKKEYHFYISDDREHDIHYVEHCFKNFFANVKERGIKIDKHYVWSDGCAAQFKSSRPFYALCRYHRNENIPHVWSFFESGHGKGEHDGAGACIKRAIRKYQMNYKGVHIKNAHDVVEWCKTHFAPNENDASSRLTQAVPYRKFWEIKGVDRKIMHGCKRIEKTRSLHSVMSTNYRNWMLNTRDYSCFCCHCIADNYEECINQDRGYVGAWNLVPLVVTDTFDRDEDENFDDVPLISTDYDHISGLVKIGKYI